MIGGLTFNKQHLARQFEHNYNKNLEKISFQVLGNTKTTLEHIKKNLFIPQQ